MVIPLDDETYFTGTDATNDVNGDGYKDTDGDTDGYHKSRGWGWGGVLVWWDWWRGKEAETARRRERNMYWDGCLHRIET